MSSAPTSLPSPAASSEAFAQSASVNHGVSDHLRSSGLFQPLQLEREDEHFAESNRREGQKRERMGRKSGGGGRSLNPLAKEFVPGAASSISGRSPNSGFDSQFGKGGNKGSINRNWRPRGGHLGSHRHSVNLREDATKSNPDYSTTGASWASSGGGLSSALRNGGKGQTNRRASRAYGEQTSSGRFLRGQSSTSNAQTSGAGPTLQGSRKGQGFNANHLLNFQYDPINRSSPRAPLARRPRKPQPFDKELFLQANFRFLVSDFGDYMLNTSDPDKMLQWEDVAAVNFAAPVPVQCPICLDPPLCPQITTCGHIFCFPCILRYLLMGVQEVRGEHWKKCPLCFAMSSSKELRTVLIDDVQQHSVGDKVKFTVLMRAKGSIIPFERTEMASGPLAYSKDGQCHLFSKFTLTSDAEPTTSKAITELTLWAERVQLEGGEDIDLLPFAFVAIDQLRQRKDAWTEHRAMEFLSSSPPVRQRIMAQAKSGTAKESRNVESGNPSSLTLKKSKSVEGAEDLSPTKTLSRGTLDPEKVDVVVETEAAMAELKEKAGWVYESAFSDDEAETRTDRKMKGLIGQNLENRVIRKPKSYLDLAVEKAYPHEESIGEPGRVALAAEKAYPPEESTGEPGRVALAADKAYPREESIGEPGRVATTSEDVEKQDQQSKKEQEERESYTFYQAADGQILILHPLNVKCLLHHYGSYEALPTSLEATLVELETVTQTELTRKRYRYLSHLPLTAIFQLCEVDLSNLLPDSAFLPFSDDLRSRENRRRRILEEDKEQKALEERTAAAAAAKVSGYAPPTDSDFAATLTDTHIDEGVSSGDFEDPFGHSPGATVSPPEHEDRKLFSRVTKLGFASGYDAPELATRRSTADSSAESSPTSSSAWTSEAGPSRGPISFADIIVAHEQEGAFVVGNKVGSKKGKKASKVVMTTAGGRRY